MVNLSTGRKRSRDQLLDAVSATRLNIKSVQSVLQEILTPVGSIADRYDYVEKMKVSQAIINAHLALRYLEALVEDCTQGATSIADEG